MLEKEKMLVPSIFLLFPQCFQNVLLSRSLNFGLCAKELKIYVTVYLLCRNCYKLKIEGETLFLILSTCVEKNYYGRRYIAMLLFLTIIL